MDNKSSQSLPWLDAIEVVLQTITNQQKSTAEEAEIQSQEAIEVAKISQNQVIEVERKLTETRLIEEN